MFADFGVGSVGVGSESLLGESLGETIADLATFFL